MLNEVILIGNLGAAPDVRLTPNGMTIATVRISTSRRWKDRQTGQRQEKAVWHRVVFFGKQAETVRYYVKKGQQFYVEGRIRNQKW